MVCLDCGRPAAEFSSFCIGCRRRYQQHPAGRAGFWNKFITKSNRYTRQYNFARPAGAQGSFSGWWPLKLLFSPAWVLRKIIQLVW